MCKDSNYVKISFIGDIMCEKPLMKAAKGKNGQYNFDKVFVNMEKLFKESDYIVGNLETVCAGKEKKYTDHIYNFNTPDSFIESIAKSGIHMVTTANNHCLDRGIYGLKRTISVLERNKVEHIGTYISPEEQEKVFIKNFNGVKVSFLNYTYGTNLHVNNVKINENEKHYVNLLKSQKKDIEIVNKKKGNKSFKTELFKFLFKVISVEQWIQIKKTLGLTHNRSYSDNDIHVEEDYLEKIKQDIKKAKERADYVVVCMHSGGQFNETPGEFSKYMMKFMSRNGVDLVLGTHPHVVQKHENINGMLALYSIGNFNISPSSIYLIDDNLPNYGIMFHLYLKNGEKDVKFDHATFSILIMDEDKTGYVKTYPIDEFIQQLSNETEKEAILNNAKKLYNKFTMKNVDKINIQKEYDLILN